MLSLLIMIEPSHNTIVSALSAIKSRLAAVTLIAVSKQQPAEKVLLALEAGQRVFGENRVQEAAAKWPLFKKQFPDIELHLIGPLQTNKVKEALAIFDVIETLDRYALAQALAKSMEKTGNCPTCYIQVNTGNEPQKSGIPREDAHDFIAYCKEELHLPIAGLMCIPPVAEDPAFHFGVLAALAKQHNLPFLSMGMSDDYAVAIDAGATHIRLGRAIFGERE